ncbi:hypothetical protein M514_09736 [Trichuris suis]|uniref:Uncharacterized protein n=1 Tax=Trichuris suis TaxID=68888 RepID=A0A085LWM7_9BILA|nr:hypothetical protein M513_09736 [Trichuris suis]KFD64560.1 hypothetical protein M514_09736 [Trichuris suis]
MTSISGGYAYKRKEEKIKSASAKRSRFEELRRKKKTTNKGKMDEASARSMEKKLKLKEWSICRTAPNGGYQSYPPRTMESLPA